MNRKHILNSLLILTTLVIWVWVFKMIFASSPEEKHDTYSGKISKPNRNFKPMKEFEFLNNYQDPFRIIISKDTIKKNDTTSKTKLPSSSENIPISTSNISYKGIINNRGRISAVILWNGGLKLLIEKDRLGEFVISKIYNDSIILLNNKRRYVILKL